MFKTKALSNAIRYSLLLGSVALAPNALAQENDLNSDVELEEEAPERIVVTGSRIRKAEFSNASPIQIINGDLSREMGLFDAGSMLQYSCTYQRSKNGSRRCRWCANFT